MPRGFKTTMTECSLDISAQLAKVSKEFQNNLLSFEETQEKIDSIYQNYLEIGDKLSFKELLALNHLTGGEYEYGFVYDSGNNLNINQRLIEILNIDRPALFRYRDTAYNKIKGLFGHYIFKYLFVNLTKGVTKPYPVTKSEINKNIQNLKNQLCKDIVKTLDIKEFADKNFFTSTGAVFEDGEFNYVRLMNNVKVSNFLNLNLDLTLDNPVDLTQETNNAQKLSTIGKLFILNNFDLLLKNELGELIKFDINFEGSINNSNYAGDIDGVSTEYWADDSELGKDIRNYTSNLAKFILSQIPRAKKIGNKEYKVEEGAYLNANDLYVLGHILRLAEYEYNLKHQNDSEFSPIILNVSTTEAFRKLLSLTDLPAIKNAKHELLDSIDYFLYVGDTDTNSILDLYKKNISDNLNILDIESIIAFEASQSYAPTYVEFDEDGIPESKNYGGVYEQGNSLKWGLTDFIFQLLKGGKKFISKSLDTKLITPKSLELLTLLTLGLGFNALATEYVDNFASKHLNTLLTLLKQIQDGFYKDTLKKAKLEIDAGNDLDAYKSVETYVKGLSLPREFRKDYNTTVSERAIMEFDNLVGDSLPAYRLNSALTNDAWFIHNYKYDHPSGLNLFADNPILFSKYGSSALDDNNADINQFYKDSTSYLVDFGNELEINGFNELIPQDQLHLLFLNNLIGLTENSDGKIPYIFSCLPVAYSDKKSIGLKTINLKANFNNPIGTFLNKITSFLKLLENYKIDPENTVRQIRTLDYFYRKNKQAYLMKSILNKWANLLQLNNDLELSNRLIIEDIKLDRSDNVIFNQLSEKWEILNNFLSKLSENDFRKYLWLASKNNIELVDELDYVYKKGKLKANPTIFYDFQQLKTFATFVQSQDDSFKKFLDSEEYSDMIEDIKSHMIDADKTSLYYKLMSDYFDKRWIKENKKEGIKGHYEVVSKIAKNNRNKFEDTLKVFNTLSNLIRNNYLDLVSKFYYLDPAKGEFVNAYLERARRIDSMSKRMVLYPATIQQYGLGLLKGVSLRAKVCIIEDAKEKVWNISGTEADLDIFDGSGYVSPFWSIMENNSLPGHGIDGTKKTFGVSTEDNRSTLFKWAEYPMTNEALRMSIKVSQGKAFDLLKLFKKMHNFIWTEDIDITKNIFGKYSLLPKGGPVIISDGFIFKRISRILKTGINTYKISYMEVDGSGLDTGWELDPVELKIDSIYKLWQAMGGLQSYSVENGRLIPSERSILATSDYIFNVGNIKLSNGLYNLKTVYLPLRDKFIAIAANKSAVKRGAVNINTAEAAWKSDEIELNYFTINTSNFGILLDANHHSDLSDVREMSLTISAMAALGRTSHLAEEIYNSIANLVKISLKKSSKFLTKLERDGIESALQQISKRLIDRLAKEEKIASTQAFIDMFSEDLNNLVLPISDRRFYKTFIKDVLEDLNKSSIRRRYAGLGGILNPASNVLLIYEVGGKTYLYSGLLREARNIVKNNPNLVKYLNERWADLNSTAEQKDNDIIKMFIKISIGISPELLIELFDQDNPNIERITANTLHKIKPLDTISYAEPGGKLIKTCLDSKEEYIKFWKLIRRNLSDSGILHMDVYLHKDIPHDLRLLTVSWVTEYADGHKSYHDIYATKITDMASNVTNKLQGLNNINKIISNFAELGEAIKNNC